MSVEEDERTLGGWPPKDASITLLFLQQSFLDGEEVAEVPDFLGFLESFRMIFLGIFLDFFWIFPAVLELGKALLFIGLW